MTLQPEKLNQPSTAKGQVAAAEAALAAAKAHVQALFHGGVLDEMPSAHAEVRRLQLELRALLRRKVD